MGIFDAIKDALTTDDQERYDQALKSLKIKQADLAALEAKAAAGDKAAERKIAGVRVQVEAVQKTVDELAAKANVAVPAGAAPTPEAPADNFTDNPFAKKDAVAAPAPVEEPAAPAAPAAPAEEPVVAEPLAAAPEYREYTVKKGDTLSEIGQEFGVNWREIAKLNNIKNPDLIHPGQVFKIPNA